MDYGSLYDKKYYETSCGELPYYNEAWLPFFEKIADKIVEDIHPKTVLDVGCAMGYLVAALRDRGVEAFGIDVSEYAISKVRKDIKPYCKVASAIDELPKELPQRYDLIVTIEVAEHLYEEDCEKFISNICGYADDIIFSSSPEDTREDTHFNVQQPEYWAKRFAKHNFYKVLSYNASYISNQAIRFIRRDIKNERIVEDYERNLRILKSDYKELLNKYDQVIKDYNYEKELLSTQTKQSKKHIEDLLQTLDQIKKEKQIKDQEDKKLSSLLQISQQKVYFLENELEDKQNKINSLENELKNKQSEIYTLENEIKGKQGEIYALIEQVNERDTRLNGIYGSRCYRLILKYYRFRNFVIPRGSKRFILAKVIFRAPRYIAQGYITKTLRYIKKNGFNGLKRKIKEVVIPESRISTMTKLPTEPIAESIGLHPIILPKKVPLHSENVDIIICVHNAYKDVKRCVESVFEYTSEPYHIIFVDDGSDEETRDYLLSIQKNCSNVSLIRNENGNGYTIAANMGLRISSADYCVLLNSDTIVTEGWIDKMIACAKSDDRIGIVGPLSNTASWQSVPNLFGPDGDWCHNEIPKGYTVEDVGKLIEKYTAQSYIKLPLLNGFCMMISRNVINAIGYLDEENFGKGFGEEDDFNLRASKAGFLLAVADDTYIFHAQSKSYSDEKRLELCEKSNQKVRKKHGDEMLDNCIYTLKNNYILEGIRARVSSMFEREDLIQDAKEQWEGKRILFILPIADAGGGGNVVIQEAITMIEMGLDVWLYNIRSLKQFFETSYPNLKIPILYGDTISDFKKVAEDFDVICSTLYSSVKYCHFENCERKPIIVYFIQDFEPFFFSEGSKEYKEAFASYTAIEDMIRVTKTTWNQCQVKKMTGADSILLGPSVNIDLFRPRKMFGNSDKAVITAMIRPESPRRAAMLTMEVLYEIKRKYGNAVEIITFGSDPQTSYIDKEFFDKLPYDFTYHHVGKLNTYQVAGLLSLSDIFVDLSSFQAMGLTAMEAMACGCSVIVPSNGGAIDFAENRKNSLVIDTHDKVQCINALSELIENIDFRNRLAIQSIRDMSKYYPEKATYNFLKAIFK